MSPEESLFQNSAPCSLCPWKWGHPWVIPTSEFLDELHEWHTFPEIGRCLLLISKIPLLCASQLWNHPGINGVQAQFSCWCEKVHVKHLWTARFLSVHILSKPLFISTFQMMPIKYKTFYRFLYILYLDKGSFQKPLCYGRNLVGAEGGTGPPPFFF